MTGKKILSTEFIPMGVLLGCEPEVEVVSPDEEARRIVAQARQEAEGIVAAAREQAAAIEKEAEERGYAAGFARGEEEGREPFLAKAAALARVLEAVGRHRAEVHQQWLADLRHVVLAVLDRVVAHEVSVNPRVITACLRRTLAYVAEGSRVEVRLHPEDFQRLRQAALADPGLLADIERIDLVEDPSLEVGDCLLETGFGEVDGSVPGFWQRLRPVVEQAFLAGLAEEAAAAGDQPNGQPNAQPNGQPNAQPGEQPAGQTAGGTAVAARDRGGGDAA